MKVSPLAIDSGTKDEIDRTLGMFLRLKVNLNRRHNYIFINLDYISTDIEMSKIINLRSNLQDSS